MKVGPEETEIALLIEKKLRKKEEINASKIYSLSSKFTERLNYGDIEFFLSHCFLLVCSSTVMFQTPPFLSL